MDLAESGRRVKMTLSLVGLAQLWQQQPAYVVTDGKAYRNMAYVDVEQKARLEDAITWSRELNEPVCFSPGSEARVFVTPQTTRATAMADHISGKSFDTAAREYNAQPKLPPKDKPPPESRPEIYAAVGPSGIVMTTMLNINQGAPRNTGPNQAQGK